MTEILKLKYGDDVPSQYHHALNRAATDIEPGVERIWQVVQECKETNIVEILLNNLKITIVKRKEGEEPC